MVERDIMVIITLLEVHNKKDIEINLYFRHIRWHTLSHPLQNSVNKFNKNQISTYVLIQNIKRSMRVTVDQNLNLDLSLIWLSAFNLI